MTKVRLVGPQRCKQHRPNVIQAHEGRDHLDERREDCNLLRLQRSPEGNPGPSHLSAERRRRSIVSPRYIAELQRLLIALAATLPIRGSATAPYSFVLPCAEPGDSDSVGVVFKQGVEGCRSAASRLYPVLLQLRRRKEGRASKGGGLEQRSKVSEGQAMTELVAVEG